MEMNQSGFKNCKIKLNGAKMIKISVWSFREF